jgi:hypothetical protein
MTSNLILRKFIYRVFDFSFGRLTRLFQRSLRNRAPYTVLELVAQNAIQESADYAIKNFGEAILFDSRSELWSYCLDSIPELNSLKGGIIAEFGVYKGQSINFFAKKCPNSRVFGFDSFEGLEENWYGFRSIQGAFNTYGKMPKVESNVKLIKGWFEDTLPNFIQGLKQEQISILHMDADTYKPTQYVLNALHKNLGTGSIIIFDEYFGYPNWVLHEVKAFQEFIDTFNIKYKFVGYSNFQVAVEIL